MISSSLSDYTSSSLINTRNYMILFILWPFLAFLTALANYSQKESRKVVYFFLIYYGLTFYISTQGMDSERYALFLKDTAELPFSDFFQIVGGLYTDTTVDIMEPLVRFIVSRFTSYHGILFAVWTAIMGFFYLRSIDLLYVRYKTNPAWTSMIFLAFFVMVMPVTTISGIRMPTAIWMFFFGAYHVILYRNPRYILLTLSSCLVHWSFISVNVILLLYYLIGNRNFLYYVLVLFSFILPGLFSSVFETIAMKLGGPLQARYEGYSNSEYILGINEQAETASWFIGLNDRLIFYFILFALIFVQITLNFSSKEKSERNLYSFILLFLAFVNFGKIIPAFGGRFQDVFLLFATSYIFLNVLRMKEKYRSILAITGLFPILLYSAVTLRIGTETINSWIITPGIGLPLALPGFSLAELLFY